MASDTQTRIRIHIAGIAEEIERTREICERSLQLLRLPVPSTFLGKKFEPSPGKDERRYLRLEIADYLHSKEPSQTK